MTSKPPSLAFLIRSSHIYKKIKDQKKERKKETQFLWEFIKILHLRGASWVMNGAGEENSTVAINDDGSLIICDATLNHGGSNQQCR